MRFHGLRHSHASVGITLDVHGHVIPALQEEAAEKIDAGLRAALSADYSGLHSGSSAVSMPGTTESPEPSASTT